MTRNLENAVRYSIDVYSNSGLRIFDHDPEGRLNDLEYLLEQIGKYHRQIDETLGNEEALLSELFPRNIVADRCPNPMGLSNDLVGLDVGVAVTDDRLRELGLVEAKRKRKGRGRRSKRRAFKFRGQIEYMPLNITYDHVFELYEKHGVSHELKSFGVDVQREYKTVFVNRKMETHYGLDDYLSDLRYLLDYLAAVFCFCLKGDSQNFRGDPTSHLEEIYEFYDGLLESYREIQTEYDLYLDLLFKYEGISRNNFSDSDISHVDSVAAVWEMTEEIMCDEISRYEFQEELGKAEVVTRWWEIMAQDKAKIDALNDTKLFEREVLEENCLVEIRDLQAKINKLLRTLYGQWRRSLGGWSQFASDLYIPSISDYGDIKYHEIDCEDAQILDEIKEKYLDVLFDEVDVETMFDDLKSRGVGVDDIERFDMWKFMLNYEFADELETLKLQVFMDHIVWISMGPTSFVYLNQFLKDLYKYYLDAPPELKDCSSVEDYVQVLTYEYSEDEEKEEAARCIVAMKGSFNMLSLDADVRAVVLDVLRNNDKGNLVCIADYYLEDTQIVLNMRQIKAFMKIMGAKITWEGGHMKCEVSITGGSYSYVVPKSTVSNGEYYIALLYRNIAYSRRVPRQVDSGFLELFKAAFEKIGGELKCKN